MDLQKLEADLVEFERRSREWRAPIHEMYEKNRLQVGRDGYTEEDRERDMWAFYRQRVAIYNPAQAEYPIREALLSFYPVATPEERVEIRAIVRRVYHASGILLSYILKCAECLESPEDGWILYSGLVAAAIEDHGHDFRDTDFVITELAIAAFDARIDIETYSRPVIELCRPDSLMMSTVKDFHIYAINAEHLDFMG